MIGVFFMLRTDLQLPPFSSCSRVIHCEGDADTAITEPEQGTYLMRVPPSASNPWDVELHIPLTQALNAGTLVTVTFTACSTYTGAALIFMFRSKSSKFGAHFDLPLVLSGEWRAQTVRFVTTRAYALDDEPHIYFSSGRAGHEIAIRDITVTHEPHEGNVMPKNAYALVYGGMEEDAAWRAEAEERIRTHRMTNIPIRVVRKDGTPVANAEVRIAMKRHAYGFGTAVNSKMLEREGEDADTYKAILATLFNVAVFENAMKWEAWERDEETPLRHIAWLRDKGLRVKGHTVIWPGNRWLPKRIVALGTDKERIRQEVEARIRDIHAKTKGQLAIMDVVNEIHAHNDLLTLFGFDVLDAWFRLAHETDPDVRLSINDFGILADDEFGSPLGTVTDAAGEWMDRALRLFSERNTPCHLIGFQAHFGWAPPAITDVLARIDRFAQYGKGVWVTEFDCDVSDEEAQAAYEGDFYTAFFSHPATEGIIRWGFWEGRHWKPESAMFRHNWRVKPNGRVYQDLVFDTWWTDATAVTDEEGRVRVRGFKGVYDVFVCKGRDDVTCELDTEKEGEYYVTV